MKSRMMIGFLVIAIAAAVIGGATMAIFWDTDAIEEPVQFTAGTLLIDIDNFDMVTVEIDLDLLNPGDEWVYEFDVVNVGTKCFYYKGILCWEGIIGQLNTYTEYLSEEQRQLLIEKEYGTNCLSEALNVKIEILDVSWDGIIYDGLLATLLSPAVFEDRPEYDPAPLCPGESNSYQVTFTFPLESGNEYQGGKIRASLTVMGWQTTNDAEQPVLPECPELFEDYTQPTESP